MIASAILATTLASTTPQAAPAAPAAAPVSAQSAAPAAKPAMAGGKMACCKDGCGCCGKDKAAKSEPAHEHAH